ncbi:hypothetical protein RHSIM_Rhsim04G0046300 [Rhododendron simsii]|uniref:IQ-domain 33 n=1 Tax=Rhododendron simsii TaxID=118357 RepID=A0A834GYK9_RHOSS|nr:hypothetical protein RHSIM_Rhsim04G0046300 [Rhododendron simsii]
MGITGGLVRSVFSKSRSVSTLESNVRNSGVEKRRWRSSVRSYLCGDEYNSVMAEEDSASVKSSEVTFSKPIQESSEGTITQTAVEESDGTVMQPLPEEFNHTGEIQSQVEKLPEEKRKGMAKQFRQEDAAITIQTAFRAYLARRGIGGIDQSLKQQESVGGGGSPSRESPGTSIEVQTGNSTDVFSTKEEIMSFHHRLQQKARTTALKLKEDWDDSTVSSNISKMRIQNRLEATTRRERALAYAFSQQLRICAKKKQNRCDGTERNMGWSWLERWMATRIPETSSVESFTMNQFEPVDPNQRSVANKSVFDVGGEERESCGSNEVSAQIERFSSVYESKEKDGLKPAKNRLKAARSISKRKTVPSYYNCPREHSKATKKDCPREEEKDKKHKQKQEGIKREITCKDAATQLSPDIKTSSSS